MECNIEVNKANCNCRRLRKPMTAPLAGSCGSTQTRPGGDRPTCLGYIENKVTPVL
jgi:hypothetical protein